MISLCTSSVGQKPSRNRMHNDQLLLSMGVIEHEEDEEDEEEELEDEGDDGSKENKPPELDSHPSSCTPTGTPIKNLPFSPSQVRHPGHLKWMACPRFMFLIDLSVIVETTVWFPES